jgi:hypothetical protein
MTEEEQQLHNEIAANSSMQAYFEKFKQNEVDSFLNSYVTYKKMWLQYAGNYVTDQHEDPIRWVNQANEHLSNIQQKKLFDMQCLWRAEKTELPEISISNDFRVWEHNILNCPFLEPITREDIDLYAQYLLYENPDTGFLWGADEDWQEHDEIIEAYKTDNENRNFPEWYDFYNGRRGTGVYMTLPDIRGEKEAVYEDIARKHEQEERERDPAYVKPAPYEPAKSLSYYDVNHREWFIKTFETKQVQELYAAWEWKHRNRDMEEDLQYYMETLIDADEPVPMPANYNWQEAIKQAANSFVNKKIAEALPEAWEQYLMKRQMNIAFSIENESMHKTFLQLKKFYEGLILKGRKLSGEPEDFDF